MSEQNVYEVAAGIAIYRSNTLGGSVTTRIGELRKIMSLPGIKFDTFEITNQDQIADDPDDNFKKFAATAFGEGKDITFQIGGDDDEMDAAWEMGGQTLNFEMRYKGGAVYPFTAVVSDVQDVDENGDLRTQVTLKPSGKVSRQ